MENRRGKRDRPRGEALKILFLDHLRKAGNVSEAARAAGVDRKTVYNWRRGNHLFSERWKLALEEATDMLEAEARRRALEGYEEPVLYAGRVICDPEGKPMTRKRYSDGLLRMLLRAHRPASFCQGRGIFEESEIRLSLTESDEKL